MPYRGSSPPPRKYVTASITFSVELLRTVPGVDTVFQKNARVLGNFSSTSVTKPRIKRRAGYGKSDEFVKKDAGLKAMVGIEQQKMPGEKTEFSAIQKTRERVSKWDFFRFRPAAIFVT